MKLYTRCLSSILWLEKNIELLTTVQLWDELLASDLSVNKYCWFFFCQRRRARLLSSLSNLWNASAIHWWRCARFFFFFKQRAISFCYAMWLSLLMLNFLLFLYTGESIANFDWQSFEGTVTISFFSSPWGLLNDYVWLTFENARELSRTFPPFSSTFLD